MHDPARHSEYIQQCLRQDKAPIGFFLSAGCPVSVRVRRPSGRDSQTDPLIPDIRGMTEHVRGELESSKYADGLKLLLASAAALEPESAQGPAGPNIEVMLSTARALRSVVGEGEVHGLNKRMLTAIEHELSASIAGLASVSLPADQTPYRALAAWAGAIPRSRAVEVFTTNYDLLLEQALEELRVPYFDGFVGSREPFFDIAAIEHDEIPARWVRLWKLHGSINWQRGENGVVTRTAGVEPGEHALIHPSHLKYEQSRRMPYLAMIDRLRAFLSQRGASLVVCGYSFNDDHLNEVIVQGLEGNPTAAAFGLMFGDLDDYPRAIRSAALRPNLSVLAKDAAIVGTHRAGWSGPISETQTNASVSSTFELGDFAVLGSLLAKMIGDPTLSGPNQDD